VAFDSTYSSIHSKRIISEERFGKKGSGNGELDFPTSMISIDSEDVVYVTEYHNHRVSVFTCEGEFLRSFGTKGIGPGQFAYPRGIAVDKNGVGYVSDMNNNHLLDQLFSERTIYTEGVF
jgi:tripartite motif-containing protein 2/3/tripartite motif-containing protein 71